MKKYKQIKYYDMIKIETLLEEGAGITDIAIKIGKHKTTVYRCIKKNSNDGKFDATKVWHKINERKSRANSHPRIMADSMLEKYILEKIESYWSPDQIAGTWQIAQGEALSHETIYKYIYDKKPELVQLYFRRKGVKYRKKREARAVKLKMRLIDERPLEVNERKKIGHWEGDTITDKTLANGIVTNVERKSGFLIASKVQSRTSQQVCDITIKDFQALPAELRLSMTYDQGTEFAKHKIIEAMTKMTIYFAHKHCPWERGSNESVNGLLRQFIPKGSNLNKVSEKVLAKYVNLLNTRPRKRLNYQTPAQVLQQELDSCT